jgi:hypothetical protein
MTKGPAGWVRRLSGKDEFDCDDIQENCSEFVDEEMPTSVTQKFRAHIDSCGDCNTFVQTFRATVMTLRDLPRRTAANDLQGRIQARIASEGDKPN